MPTSNARRHEIDRLREKAEAAHDNLLAALNKDGHDEDCVLRCMAIDEHQCFQEHSCSVCREDGEV